MSKHLTKSDEMNRTLALSHAKRSVYQGFFSVEEHDLSYQKFNKEQSSVVTRSTIVSSDAVQQAQRPTATRPRRGTALNLTHFETFCPKMSRYRPTRENQALYA